MKKLLIIFLFLSSLCHGQTSTEYETPFIIKQIDLDYDDLTQYGAETTVTINIYTLDSLEQIHASRVINDVSFAGPSLTDFEYEVNYTYVIIETDSTTGSGGLGGEEPFDPGGTSEPGTGGINIVHSENTRTVVSIRIQTTGCNLEDLTAGSLVILLWITRLPE